MNGRIQRHAWALAVGAEDAAAMLGIGRTRFLELDRAGRIPAPIVLGRRCRRWSVEALRAWVAEEAAREAERRGRKR